MMNNEIIERLKGLQEIDIKISGLNKQCLEKASGLDFLKENIKNLQGQLEAARQKAKQLKIEVDKKDLELKSNEEKINKLKTQLNTVKTNKEYSLLTSEIKSAKADNDIIEDVILNLFNQNESVQKEVSDIEIQIKDETGRMGILSAKIDGEIAVMKIEIEAAIKTRSEGVSRIDSDTRSKYEKIISNKSDRVALVCVNEFSDGNYTCQGCNMDVTPQQVNELMKHKEIICCKSCMRILYVDRKNEHAGDKHN